MMVLEALLQRRAAALAGVVLLTLLAAWQVTHLTFDEQVERYFPAEHSDVANHDRFTKLFGLSKDALMIVARTPDAFSTAAMKTLQQLSLEIAELEGVRRVHGLATTPEIRANREDIVLQAPWHTDASPQEIYDALQRLRRNPLFANHFVATEVDAIAMWVDLDASMKEQRAFAALHSQVTELVEKSADPSLQLLVGGAPAVRHGYSRLMQSDLARLLPLGGVIAFLILLWCLRHIVFVVVSIASVGTAIVWTLGSFAASGGSLSALSSMVPIILLVIGLPDTVHVIVSYQQHRQRHPHRQSLLLSTGKVMRACLLTSCTTAMGFLVLLRTDMPAVRSFGVLCAVGVAATFVCSVLVTPLLLSYFHAWKPRARRSSPVGLNLLHAPLQWPRLSLALSAFVFAGMIAGAGSIDRNIRIYGNVADGHPLLQVERFADAHLGGSLSLDVVLSTDQEDGALQHDVVRAVQDLEAFLANQERIHSVRSYMSFVRAAHQAAEGDQEAVVWESPSLVSQYLLLLSMSDVDPTTPFLDDARQHTRVVASISDIPQEEFFLLTSGIYEHLKQLPSGITGTVSGTASILHHVYRRVVTEMAQGFAIAFIVVFVVFVLAFKSPGLALLAMVPNILPTLGCLGVLGWSGIPLGPTTALVFAIAFGIAVDDTVHVLAHFQHARWTGATATTALAQSINAIAAPILWTSLILASGFSVLMASSFLGNVYFAVLMACTVGLAVLADLVVLPSLVALLEPALDRSSSSLRSSRVFGSMRRE